MIEVKNLSKVFQVHQKEAGLKGSLRSLFKRQWLEKWALKNVSLQVTAGEIVGLIGANGAGKTTLMKILAGIIHPTSGEAKVLGFTPWERKNDFRKQISLIMGQKAQLWWDLPAADCFLLLREIYQIPEDLFEKNLKYLVEALQVENQMKIQIRRLSLGERMKMELIAALLHQPKIVYLDEPTIGLDINAQKTIREFLLEYRKTHHPAMIVTSHYMEDIQRLCERIVIIREGEFLYDGPLKQVVKKFTASKVVTAHLTAADNLELARNWVSSENLIVASPELLKIRVKRETIPEVCGQILKNLQVNDLAIEEEDITEVISKLLKEKSI